MEPRPAGEWIKAKEAAQEADAALNRSFAALGTPAFVEALSDYHTAMLNLSVARMEVVGRSRGQGGDIGQESLDRAS